MEKKIVRSLLMWLGAERDEDGYLFPHEVLPIVQAAFPREEGYEVIAPFLNDPTEYVEVLAMTKFMVYLCNQLGFTEEFEEMEQP